MEQPLIRLVDLALTTRRAREINIVQREIPGYTGGLPQKNELDLLIKHTAYADLVTDPELPQI